MFKDTQQHYQALLQLNPLSLAIGIALSLPGAFQSVQAETPAAGVQATARQSVAFSINPQPLSSALLRFAEQAGLQVFFADVRLENMQSVALNGRFTPEQGLNKMIGINPVDFSIDSNGVITLRPRAVNVDTAKVNDVITVRAVSVANPGDWIYEQPRAISVISREQMDKRPPRHAADMLEESAGVYSAVSQQDPGLSVNIRGIQDFGRVNMNIDGMRQNFQKSDHGQRNGTMFIDSELLSTVTIEKGASSGMGGANAIGGIATFNTLSASDFLFPGKELGGQLRATTGDNGTNFIGSSALALGNENGDILIAASERNLSDYWPGNRGDIGRNPAYPFNEELKHSIVEGSGISMHSRLVKLGANLPESQRIQLSYLQSWAGYSDNSSATDTVRWDEIGRNKMMSRNAGLDYSVNPDNPLIDIKAKIYYVDNYIETNRYARIADGFTGRVDDPYRTRNETRTYGLQLENTSFFQITPKSALTANYGVEFFYDKVKSQSTKENTGGLTPSGNRSVASLFSELQYDYDDWLTANAGLRYDQYRLRGQTGLWVSHVVSPPKPKSKDLITETVWEEYDIDNSDNSFSPTAGLAIKPGINWLQIFTTYGKAWRPPAATETLNSGIPHGTTNIYPNPFLEAEKSKDWEIGFNVTKPDLLFNDDNLNIKVVYFDTKIDNFIHNSIGKRKPGLSQRNLADTAYVNNLNKTRFRGFEYTANYDTGLIYGELSWTHMIGQNKFCSPVSWLGGSTQLGRNKDRLWDEIPIADGDITQCNNIMGNAEHIPADRGSLTLGLRLLDKKLNIGARARHSSKISEHEFSGYAYSPEWRSYTLYDIFAIYKATENITLNASVENLTNKAYLVSFGDVFSNTLGKGRTFQGGFEYRF
ncbi:TonB-dependent receptor [Pectobacterium cacticida]|uniref:TonB-dependent receptor n=1 Tax=Pectobacterium cacticida TaxID=69221 RepID=UPI002FF08F54